MRALSKFLFFVAILFSPLLSLHAEPLRIGICLSASGPAARWTAAQRAGIELAAEDLQRSGTEIELFWEDPQTETVKAVSCVRSMKALHQVHGLIGEIWTYLTVAMLPVAEQLKVPLVTPSVFRELCPKKEGGFVSVAEQISDLDLTYERFLRTRPELKRIGIIYFDDQNWGGFGADAVRKAVKVTGREVVAEFKNADMVGDMRGEIPALLRKNPDAVFVFHNPVLSMRALKGAGYNGTIIQSSALGEQLWVKGESRELYEGVYFSDIPQSSEFQARMAAKFDKPALMDVQSGYDALTVLVEGLKRNPTNPLAGIRSAPIQGLYQKLNFATSCAPKHSDWRVFQIVAGSPKQVE